MLLTPAEIAHTSTHRTHHTSAQARAAVGNAKQKNQADRIFDICYAKHLHGVVDVSRVEIREAFEHIHGGRIDSSTVSARVNELISAKRLEVLPYTRNCKVNKNSLISVVRVPLALMKAAG